MNTKTSLSTLAAALLAAFSGSAAAAGFQQWEQSASGLGVAYAGSAAVADNASTIFYNPAGMTQLPGLQLSVGVSGIGQSYRFRNQNSTGAQLGTAGDGGDAGGWEAAPNFYVSQRLGDDLAIGLGVSSPFGLSTNYDNTNWTGRVQALKTEIRTVNYNPALAYRVNDKLSLGIGLNYQTIDAEMTSYSLPGLNRFKADDHAWGWNAGALLTLSPAMRVGLSYRSAIDYRLSGTRSVGAAGAAATADIKLPDTFVVSVWQQLSERWEAMGDLSWTRWSTVDKLQVKGSFGSDVDAFNYRNAWRLAWGAAYKMSERTKLKFGIAYDRTPVQDGQREARLPDNDRLWLSLGGQWDTGSYGKFDLGYSYLYVKDPGIAQSKLGTTLRGDYDSSAHIVGLQYSIGY